MNTPAPPTSRAYLRRLYRAILLPGFALALLAGMWTAVLYQIEQERISAHYEAVLHSQSLARTLAEHTNHLLRQSDHATQLFKLKFEESGGALRLAEFTRPGGLLDSLLPSKLDLPLALVGANGRLIDSRSGYFAPQLSQQAFFLHHAQNSSDTPLITTPVVEPRSKKWQIQLSRRLNHADGQFAGVIVMQIDPATFVEDYDRLNLDPGGAVMLISRENGIATARVDEQLIISDAIDFTAAQSGGRIGTLDELLLARPFDAIERIYGYAEMPRYLLLAVAGNPLQSEMTGFEQRRERYLIAVSLASLMVLLFVGLLLQQARRLRRSTQLIGEAQEMLRAAADASMDCVYLLKACRLRGADQAIVDFTMIGLNDRGAALLGMSADQARGKRLQELMPDLHTHGFFEKYKNVLLTHRPLDEEFEVDFLPSGEHYWFHHQIVPIKEGVAVTTRDITPRKKSELAIRKSQAELAAVNDVSPLGLMRADAHGQCTYVNRTFEFVTGLMRAEALGENWLRAIHPEDRTKLQAALKQMAVTRLPYQDTLRCVHPDGTIVWVMFKIAAMIVDKQVYGYVGTVDDITHVRKSVMALRESEARLRTIADTLPAMVAYVDNEEIFRFHNLAYEREFNRKGDSVLGKSVLESIGAERYAYLSPYIKRVLAGETLTFEEEDSSDTSVRTFEVVYIPQIAEDGGGVIGFHVMRQDISVQKREKQRLLRLSQIDALTGLTNRAGFLQKLSDSMLACAEQGHLMAVMYMDIDHFKPVNDTYGHSVGDALLRAFSGRLSYTMRASDTIARLGGDEFTIIMERINRPEDATTLAGKIVTTMQAPFDLDGTVVSISASIGLSFYRDQNITPAELLHQADLLLYQAKQHGRNTYRAGPHQSGASADPHAA